MPCLCPCLCPDRSHGVVLWGKGLSEEHLEHSGRDAGDDFCYRHPGVSHLELGYQDPGHAPSAEAAENSEASTVSSSPRGVKIYRQTNTFRRQTSPVNTLVK